MLTAEPFFQGVCYNLFITDNFEGLCSASRKSTLHHGKAKSHRKVIGIKFDVEKGIHYTKEHTSGALYPS